MHEKLINIFQPAFREVWAKDTSFSPDKWSPNNPSFGQCYVTALWITYNMGGEVVFGRVGRLTHYWNRIDGVEYDFTSEQFGGDGLHPVTEIKGIKKPNFNNRRFKKFLKRMTERR